VTLLIAAVVLIETRGIVPPGAIPIALILAGMPLVGLCLMTGAALVGESEGWGIAANVACNSSYGLIWYFMGRMPGLMADVKSPVPVWNPTVLKFLTSRLRAHVNTVSGCKRLWVLISWGCPTRLHSPSGVIWPELPAHQYES
jgi:hypothetical protein